eukprot:543549_1
MNKKQFRKEMFDCLQKNQLVSISEQNELDGTKLKEMNKQLVKLKQNNEMKRQINELYTNIIKYNISKHRNSDNKEEDLDDEHEQETFIVNKHNKIYETGKFITSVSTDDESKVPYYAFGEQYRYTPNLQEHPLFIKPKYRNIKHELLEYFKRINTKTDTENLVNGQLDIINTMGAKLQLMLKQLIHASIVEDTPDEHLVYLIKLQNLNWIQLIEIIKRLCQHLKNNLSIIMNQFDYFRNCLFLKLLNINFEQEMKYFNLKGISDEDLDDLDDIKDKLTHFYRAKHGEKTQKDDLEGAIKEFLKKYVQPKFVTDLVQIIIKQLMADIKLVDDDQEEKYEEPSGDHVHVADVFYQAIIKHKIYYKVIEKNENINFNRNYASFLAIAKSWAESNTMQMHSILNTIKNRSGKIYDKLKELKDNMTDIFGMDETELTAQIQKEFIVYSVQQNYEEYIRFQNQERCGPIFEKAKFVIEMTSVKQLKAVWYHGINKHHDIMVGDPLSIKHIIALICYSDYTTLCTTYRETYRRMVGESLYKLKCRHSYFGNMGKSLYESFVFFASKDSKIKILYHGMSTKLSFTTLYCAFDAPTSTTSDLIVAERFCDYDGIVLRLESSESSKYIRTLNMALFSRFDLEREHLIFETRLHINGIALRTETGYIRYKWMKVISLYDLLIHGSIVHDHQLLENTNQNRLYKLLQLIINDKLQTSAFIQYFKTLVLTLTQQKK